MPEKLFPSGHGLKKPPCGKLLLLTSQPNLTKAGLAFMGGFSLLKLSLFNPHNALLVAGYKSRIVAYDAPLAVCCLHRQCSEKA
jgi:hypothetical protein